MAFTSDSQAVMLYERQENYQTGLSEGAPVAELRSGRNLAIFWSSTLSDVRDGFQAFEGQTGQPHEPGTGSTYRPAVVFDAQAKAMYVIHADTARLTRVDFRRYATLTQDITPKLSVIERLLALGSITAHAKVQDGIERHAVISPDGSVVYTAGLQNKLTKNSSDGMWDLAQSYLPLQAIRLADAAELYRSEATGDTMDISTDGQTILLARWDLAEGDGAGTTVLDAATGAIQNEVEGYQLRHSSRLGGSPLVVGQFLRGRRAQRFHAGGLRPGPQVDRLVADTRIRRLDPASLGHVIAGLQKRPASAGLFSLVSCLLRDPIAFDHAIEDVAVLVLVVVIPPHREHQHGAWVLRISKNEMPDQSPPLDVQVRRSLPSFCVLSSLIRMSPSWPVLL